MSEKEYKKVTCDYCGEEVIDEDDIRFGPSKVNGWYQVRIQQIGIVDFGYVGKPKPAGGNKLHFCTKQHMLNYIIEEFGKDE